MSANERMRAAGERAQRRRAGLDPAAETAAAAAMQPQTVPFWAPGTTSEERAARREASAYAMEQVAAAARGAEPRRRRGPGGGHHGRMMPGAKAKDFKGTMKRMIRLHGPVQGGAHRRVPVRDRLDDLQHHRAQGALAGDDRAVQRHRRQDRGHGRHRLRRGGGHPRRDARAVPGERRVLVRAGLDDVVGLAADVLPDARATSPPRSTACPWGTSSARRSATRSRASPTTSTRSGRASTRASRSSSPASR